jgi:AcrR family transcriptional regulator
LAVGNAVSESNSAAVGPDGRTQRSAATRRRVLDVTRALLISGATEPTAAEIATQAGIATRTLFRHFQDMESLYAALVKEAQTSIATVMDEPLRADADWHGLLRQIIERRVKVYELLLPLYVSSAWLRSPAGLNSADNRKAINRRRRRLREVLPTEMASDEVVFEALDATLSIEFWLSLRRGQNLGVDRATQVLQHTVRQLSLHR